MRARPGGPLLFHLHAVGVTARAPQALVIYYPNVPAALERVCNVEPLTPMSSDVALEGHPLVLVTLGLLVLIRQSQETGRVVRAFHQYPLEVVDPVLRLGSSL